MRSSSVVKSALCLAAALVLVGCVPLCQAKSGSKVDKHAQKIEKKLSKYKTGTLVHLAFSNNTECTGTVNTLSDTSFTFNNSETNMKETHLYSEVSTVEKGKEYIGAGSAPKHHIHIF
jgi:archaellum component FlaF (FlaF/FlaG flagellin family)